MAYLWFPYAPTRWLCLIMRREFLFPEPIMNGGIPSIQAIISNAVANGNVLVMWSITSLTMLASTNKRDSERMAAQRAEYSKRTSRFWPRRSMGKNASNIIFSLLYPLKVSSIWY